MAKRSISNKAAQNVTEFRGEPEASSAVLKKSKGGCPSKGKSHKISLAIPVEFYYGVEFASYFFRGNITAYIVNQL